MAVSSLPKTVTRQRSDCDSNPGPSAPESSTLTTRLPSHPLPSSLLARIVKWLRVQVSRWTVRRTGVLRCHRSFIVIQLRCFTTKRISSKFRTLLPSQYVFTHTRLTALFLDYPGEPYQKGKTNLDFTEARDSEWQWHQLGHMQVCTSLQTDNHASAPPLKFYRPDALHAAQPTVSKH